MRVILVDDEPLARDEFRFLLRIYPQIQIVAEADNALSAVELINRHKPDVVFADIHMPKVTGLELAGMFSGCTNSPHWVFVTAYDQHAIDAFSRDARDYLLKPVEPERLAQCIERLERLDKDPEQKPLKRISVQTGTTIVFFDPESILFAESDGVGVRIVGEQEGHTSVSLKQLEASTALVRCHRQHLINVDRIDKLRLKENGCAEAIIGKHQVPISRRYLKAIKEALGLEGQTG